MAKKRTTKPSSDPRPRFFECRSSADYEALCARKRAGELSMWHIDSGDPRTGILWTVEVIYSQPLREQLEILQ